MFYCSNNNNNNNSANNPGSTYQSPSRQQQQPPPPPQQQVYLNATHYDGSGSSINAGSTTNITSNHGRSSNGPVVLRRNKKKQQNLGTFKHFKYLCNTLLELVLHKVWVTVFFMRFRIPLSVALVYLGRTVSVISSSCEGNAYSNIVKRVPYQEHTTKIHRALHIPLCYLQISRYLLSDHFQFALRIWREQTSVNLVSWQIISGTLYVILFSIYKSVYVSFHLERHK